MPSPIRDGMSPESGKMRDSDDAVVDLTAVVKKLDTVLSAVTGLKVNADVNVGDIEIGAVELKDGATDTRAEIAAANAGNTTATKVLKIQPVDGNGNVIMGGASASSGDNTHMSPTNFTATYASGTALTLTGLDFVPEIAQFVSVKRQDTSGVSATYAPDVNAFGYNPTTGVLTVTGAAFTATDKFVVTVLGEPKYTDTGADAKKQVEQAPVWTHGIGDTLAAVTNQTVAVNYYYLDVSTYEKAVFQFKKTGGTDVVAVTLEATAQDDGTADSSCTYQDITQYGATCLSAAAAASYAGDVMLRADCKGLKHVRVKVAVTISASDLDYVIYGGRAY